MKKLGILLGATLALVATTIAAHAFCGFYVAGSNQKMFNDATQVVLMREGTRTVLSMQNDYRGPLEDFAMVVPVPVVLATFTADPPSITADVATPITWSFRYANQPWPEPACTVDHGVGQVTSGTATSVTLQASTTLTLTCANSAGKSEKQIKISVI